MRRDGIDRKLPFVERPGDDGDERVELRLSWRLELEVALNDDQQVPARVVGGPGVAGEVRVAGFVDTPVLADDVVIGDVPQP